MDFSIKDFKAFLQTCRKHAKNNKQTVIIAGNALFLVILLLVFSGDKKPAESTQSPPPVPASEQMSDSSIPDEMFSFISTVIADTENVWAKLFEQYGRLYSPPHVKLYKDRIDSVCGEAFKADGPFYCPDDAALYIDPAFLRDLKITHPAEDNFALAYVLAHEIGHHVQNQWGILEGIKNIPDKNHTKPLREITVELELMADCLAGVWAARQDGKLLPSTITSGMEAAHKLVGRSVPKNHVAIKMQSHGSLEERAKWFTRGYESGEMTACNTLWEK